jgi:protein phosphatase
MPYDLVAAGLSDVGLVRMNNEDAWGKVVEERFFVLADGMGGHQAGEVAAKELVEGLCQFVKRNFSKKTKKKRLVEEILSKLQQGIDQVNTKIFAMSYSSDALKGMGTTFCLLFFYEEGLILGHVGDSRIYRLRAQKIKQLTRDDSLLREMMEQGQLNEQQAGDFLYKNILTKAVGTEPEVTPTLTETEIEPGDLYLMCTDGLTDMVTEEEIEQTLNTHTDINKACAELVHLAKERGGVDNITVVLVKVTHETKDLSR